MRYTDITPLFIFQLGLMLFKCGNIGIELQLIAGGQRLIGQQQHPAIAQGQLDARAPIGYTYRPYSAADRPQYPNREVTLKIHNQYFAAQPLKVRCLARETPQPLFGVR
jgi:hypothetical protein